MAIHLAQAKDTAHGGEMSMFISVGQNSLCEPLMLYAWLVDLLCTMSVCFSYRVLGLVFLPGFLLSLYECMYAMTLRTYECLDSHNGLHSFMLASLFSHFLVSTFTPTSLVHAVKKSLLGICCSHDQGGLPYYHMS